MQTEEFNERIARVRQRYAGTLRGKIDDNFAALPELSGKDAGAIDAIVAVHRRLHEMCGIAPSVGFAATGAAARAAETVLREPADAKRPMTADEIAALESALELLRATALADLRSG